MVRTPLFISMLLLFSCSVRPIVKTDSDQQLSTEVKNTLVPPLELLWKTSVSTAPARNLAFYKNNLLIPNLYDKLCVLDISKGKVFKRMKVRHPVLDGVVVKGSDLIWTSPSNQGAVYKISLVKPKEHLKSRSDGGFVRPLVLDDQIIVASIDNVLRSLSIEDLKPDWSVELDAAVRQEIAIAGEHILFTTENGLLYSIKRETGKVIFKRKLPCIPTTGIFLDDDFGYLGSRDGKLLKFEISSGQIEWITKTDGRIITKPLLADDNILIGDCANTLYIVDAMIGEILDTIDTGAPISTDFVRSGEYIYWGDLSHNINCLKLSEKKIVWSYKLQGRLRTNPAIYRGLIFIGSEDRYIYAFYSKNGN